MPLIDLTDAENALEYLKNTDNEHARLKAHANALDDMKKPILASVYNEIESGSAAEKTKIAEGSEIYKSHIEKLKEANEDFYRVNNKRLTAVTQIDMWRSINSNQRKGNI